MNMRWLFPTIALILTVLPSGRAAPIAMGDPRDAVIRAIGMPLRELHSDSGNLMVYSNSFVYLVDGKVDFIGLSRPQTVIQEDVTRQNNATVSKGSLRENKPASPVKNVAGGTSHAFENHPVFAEAVQRQRENRIALTRQNTSLDAYWEILRQNFAENSRFDTPGGMLTLKTADGRVIPAVGESRPPTWRYLDMGLDEDLGPDSETQ